MNLPFGTSVDMSRNLTVHPCFDQFAREVALSQLISEYIIYKEKSREKFISRLKQN